jgi:outer membrane usher protein
VVRDLLGRETVITQPFFTSAQLLAPGLNDWSVEAGRLRLDLGTASAHYGDSFASGLWRRGLSSGLTLESRVEATRQSQNAGAGLIVGLPWQFLGKGSLVASHDQDLGAGRAWLLGIERQTVNTGAYLQAQGGSANFRQLGQDAATMTRQQVAGNFSYTTQGIGTFGVGFATITQSDSQRVSTLSTNYSVPIGQRNSLTLTAGRAVHGGSGNWVQATLIIPLDRNRVVTASAATRSGQQEYFVTASQSEGPDGGLSWRALAGHQQGQAHSEGGLYYSGRYGQLSSDLSTTPSQTAVRVGASGGLVVADSHLFATRRLDDSFAVAEVAGYGNVGIGLGSNVLTQTDAAGVALVPRMSPYQGNSIRIDPKELPISAEIDSIERVVVPAWRSGVKVVFPVRSGRGALLKIVFDDGEPAPAGAIVRIQGDKEDFYVARRGEAFVTGLQPANRVQLTWSDKKCEFDVKLPPESPDQIVRLGPLACRGVAR